MKKTGFLSLLLLVLLLACSVQSAQAQRPVGDTLRSMDTSYFPYHYNWFTMLDDTNLRSSIRLLFLDLHRCAQGIDIFMNMEYFDPEIPGLDANYYYYPIGRMISGNQLYTDRPLKILGIAACGYAQRTAYYTLPGCLNGVNGLELHPERYIASVIDTTLSGRVTDSLILYLPTPNGPVMQAAGPWRVEDPHRYVTLPRRKEHPLPLLNEWRSYDNPPTIDTFPTVPLYEVMFEKPQIVTDSFIVAGTYNNNWVQTVWPTENDSMVLWQHNPTRYWYLWNKTSQPDTDNIFWLFYARYNADCGHWQKLRPHPEWGYLTDNRWLWLVNLMFPIIDPGFDSTLCDAVRSVRVAETTDTSATLMWSGGNAVRWEVNYAEVGGTEDHTVTVSSPLAVLTGLRPETFYIARIRAMCEWDTMYGPWGDMVEYRTGATHHDEPQSIDNLDRFTQVLPNPAQGQVTVISSYRLSRVEVYDLQGRLRLTHVDEGLSTVLDVSPLPYGNYVMVIHTPAGLATKKLTVLQH